MKLRKWLAIGLIAAGLAVLLFAPIARMDVTFDFPADGGLPTVTKIETRPTPLGIGIMLGSAVSIVAGMLLCRARREPDTG